MNIDIDKVIDTLCLLVNIGLLILLIIGIILIIGVIVGWLKNGIF